MRNFFGYAVGALAWVAILTALIIFSVVAWPAMLLFTGGTLLLLFAFWLVAPTLRVRASAYAMNRAMAEFNKLLPPQNVQAEHVEGS